MNSIIRRANLKKLLQERFSGKIADMARSIERDDAYLWQLLNESKNARNVGERVARHIEATLGLARGSLDSPDLMIDETLASDEIELLKLYRRASPSWKIALRYLAALRGDVQDEISQSVNVLLSKVAAEHAPDRRVEEAYGYPPSVHQGQAQYRKKSN